MRRGSGTRASAEGKSPSFSPEALERGLTETNEPHRCAPHGLLPGKAAGPDPRVCKHTFRTTGITNYFEHDGKLDIAQEMAGQPDRSRRIGPSSDKRSLIGFDRNR